MAFLEACLHLDQISLQPLDADAVHLFHMVATVNVNPDALFGFGNVPADVAFQDELDLYNFRELLPGTSWGKINNPDVQPLFATNNEGEDVTADFFDFSTGEVNISREVMPSMLTLDRRVIQQDCLCYLMERIHFEDNEEVTTVDPLPEGIDRSDYPTI